MNYVWTEFCDVCFSETTYTICFNCHMCIASIWKQGNFPSYSGIDVTQSYNMSHCMKLHILSHTYIHTACTYVTFSGQGALQIFRTSAVATEELSCLHEPKSLYPFQGKMISTLKPCPFGICLTDVKTFWNILDRCRCYIQDNKGMILTTG